MTYDDWKTTPDVEYPYSDECKHGTPRGEGGCPDCLDEMDEAAERLKEEIL